ncbi:MAG: efflux RND transporter periplasmic adaptor subunit [Bacteroidota bacterium]
MDTDTGSGDLASLRIRREHQPSPGGARKRLWVFLVPAVAAVCLLLYLAGSGWFSARPEVEEAAAALTYPSQAGAVLTASGYVVAQQKASVASKATGRLVFLGVEEGDKVRRGEVIARLEDSDVAASLEGAQAQLGLAEADFEDARRTLDRHQTMFAAGLSSRAELDAADARFRRVEATIGAARAVVRGAEVALENTRIRAPFDGTVLTKDANVGEIVAPFASSANSRGTVVTLADMSSLEVEADVSEANITRIALRQECEIVLDAYPDRRYRGFVHKIVPTADRAKATVLTKVRFRDRDDRVLPEMSAKVAFLGPEGKARSAAAGPVLAVPAGSVVRRNGREIVLRLEGDRVVETPVRTGSRMGSLVEITEGLAEGDRVVARPVPGITSGSAVTVKK